MTRGLCRAHYLRARKAGLLKMNTETIAQRGRKIDHPEYARWNKAMAAGKVAPEWHDFWRFVDDIGPKPDGATKIQRPDETAFLGPGNWKWSEPLEGERKLAYYRERWRTNTADKDNKLRKTYGIGLAERQAMAAAQGFVCAICEQPESMAMPRKGDGVGSRELAIDHCHATNKVRGLLCGRCNQALGLFDDDVARMARAIDYVIKHQERAA